LTVTDEAVVDLNDAGELAHRAGAEHFVGAVNIVGNKSVSMHRIFSAAQISMIVARVIPSEQAKMRLVARSPRRTMKMWVAFVSATKPRVSSIKASSAPALLASFLARSCDRKG
jgi:hypothetical protein